MVASLLVAGLASAGGGGGHGPTPPPPVSLEKVRNCCVTQCGGTNPAGNLCEVASASAASCVSECVGESEENVSEFIFHHVSDSSELTFEVPLSYWVFTGMPPSAVVRVKGETEDRKIYPRTGRDVVIPLPHILVPLKGADSCAPHGGHAPGLPACLDLSITKQTVMMWLAAVLLVGFVLAFSHRSREQLVPRGKAANIIEALVLFVRDELAVKNIGKEEAWRYTPFLLTVFFFILAMNLLGLLPWMATATGNLAVTCGLALCTFFLTQVASIRSAGLGGYLAHLTGGVHWLLWPIMIPVEILGLFTKPFALTVRLFANMLAGHVVLFFLMSLVFLMKAVALAPVGVAFAFAIYLLELFVAFLQAYVFTMLSAVFIGMGAAMGHHHDDHGPAASH
ncbi:MAG: F0F1 ATP synthase subunit A [Deltaproteobacteria bacterium]|nr:F0F1 ATP synthase subunit A [Deltaproteobacteria bacterium]